MDKLKIILNLIGEIKNPEVLVEYYTMKKECEFNQNNNMCYKRRYLGIRKIICKYCDIIVFRELD